MARINSFVEIESWKKSRILIKEFYLLMGSRDTFEKYSFLKQQMLRSSLLISSNIAEGFERQTTKEFIRFLYIAKGSAGEFKSQLYIANDLYLISNEEFEKLMVQTNEILKLISGFIKYLNKTINNQT